MKKLVIIYDSLTGNGKRFLDNFNVEKIDVIDFLNSSEGFLEGVDYVLETRNVGFGKIPEDTEELLTEYPTNQIVGCIVSGNRIWGDNYGRSGKTIQERYKIPLIQIFELAGFTEDIEKFNLYLKENNYI